MTEMTRSISHSYLAIFMACLITTTLISSCETSVSDITPEMEVTSEIADSLTGSDASMRTYTATQTCSSCDLMITNSVIDGDTENIQPGDVLCLDAGISYERLLFRNIQGTSSKPVIIQNCGGVATIYSDSSYGILFENCSNLIITGSGSSDTYGIKVTTEEGFFMSMEKFTTKFEITRVEIAGPNANGLGNDAGFAGIGVKTSPTEDCDLFTDPTRQAWIMRDIYIHDNYIHDTGAEGIYMGHGYYKGRKEPDCPAVTYSHSIYNVHIYNNIVENTGYDGIQIKNADQKVKVYNNTITNYGTRGISTQNEGLFIGEGSTGQYYNNMILSGSGNGCQVQGLGRIDFYNNVISHCGENGIYASSGDYVVRWSDGYFNFFNNTIYDVDDYGYVFYNDDGGTKRFYNNLIAIASALTRSGAILLESNNLYATSSSNFADVSSSFRLKSTSAAVDAGRDLTSFDVTTDCIGTARPKGLAFDVGAYECY